MTHGRLVLQSGGMHLLGSELITVSLSPTTCHILPKCGMCSSNHPENSRVSEILIIHLPICVRSGIFAPREQSLHICHCGLIPRAGLRRQWGKACQVHSSVKVAGGGTALSGLLSGGSERKGQGQVVRTEHAHRTGHL